MATKTKAKTETARTDINAWTGFAPGSWQTRVNLREFIQRNYTPYEGDGDFLQAATDRTRGLWKTLQPLLGAGAREGHPGRVPGAVRHPGPRDRDISTRPTSSSSACRPMRRSSGPSCRSAAGVSWRRAWSPTATSRTRRAGRDFHASIARPTTTACSTRYTPDIRKARSSGIVTGLPDAYGRGRIIGDYRRVALYGVDFLISDKEAANGTRLDDRHSTEEVIRLREELAEQIRSLQGTEGDGEQLRLRHLRARPPTAREAVQWTYFGYLAAIKQQNGAADVGRPAVDLLGHLLRARLARR